MFKNKKILIVGLGISNVSFIRFLADKEILELIVTDLKPAETLVENVNSVKEIFPNAKFVLGSHDEKDFDLADLIVVSPSIPRTAPLIKKAIESGKNVESDISLFFKLCPSKNIVGITGTKGKTSTAHFLYEALLEQELSAVLAGNMGIPVFDVIDNINKKSWVVMELSSYMVESLDRHKISPKYSIYTNIFPDHLNTYKSFESYKNAKKGLFLHQKQNDVTFINSDDKELMLWKAEIPSKTIFYSNKTLPKNFSPKIKGAHYRTNYGAIYELFKNVNLDLKKLKNTVENFSGVEHRMEYLGKIDGIEYYNNSAATNPGAFLADLETLLKENKPLFLLAGGATKNLDLLEMAKKINKEANVKKVALFQGKSTDELKELISRKKVLGTFGAMQEAFDAINKVASKNGIIALNPGCASFGVFTNEFDRGNQFKAQVELLK